MTEKQTEPTATQTDKLLATVHTSINGHH